jgi:hypothetical protein
MIHYPKCPETALAEMDPTLQHSVLVIIEIGPHLYLSRSTFAKTPKPPPAAADEGYWLGCCIVGDDLRHSPMFPEHPAFSSWDISGGDRGFNPPPSAMRRETYHGIPNAGTGAAGLAGRVGICRRANRYSPSGRRAPRQ